MSDRDNLRLRAITVSTRAAHESLHGDDDAPAVKARADALLAELEDRILVDGADPELLRRVRQARIGLTDGA